MPLRRNYEQQLRNGIPEIVSIGQTSIDNVIVDDHPARKMIGGSAYIPARIWASCGLHVGLVSCLGKDLEKRQIEISNLDLRGISTWPEPATSIELRYSDQNLVGLQIYAGPSDKLTVTQIPKDYFSAQLFYISPAPLSFLVTLSELSAEHRIPLAFSPKEDFPSITNPGMKMLISRCTLCFFTRRELKRVTECNDEESAIRTLHKLGPEIIVVTKGKEGVTVSSEDDELFSISPTTVVPLNNPIGAGDCFAASFLKSWLGGQSPRQSAKEAVSSTERWLLGRQRDSEINGAAS